MLFAVGAICLMRLVALITSGKHVSTAKLGLSVGVRDVYG
jgi:hypothetical protein